MTVISQNRGKDILAKLPNETVVVMDPALTAVPSNSCMGNNLKAVTILGFGIHRLSE